MDLECIFACDTKLKKCYSNFITRIKNCMKFLLTIKNLDFFLRCRESRQTKASKRFISHLWESSCAWVKNSSNLCKLLHKKDLRLTNAISTKCKQQEINNQDPLELGTKLITAWFCGLSYVWNNCLKLLLTIRNLDFFLRCRESRQKLNLQKDLFPILGRALVPE